MNKVYKSKKDQWLVWITWFSNIVIIISVIYLLIFEGITTYSVVYGIAMILVVLFLYYLLNQTYYVIKDSEILVRCFFFKWTIRIDTIKKIFETNNMLSSPALSLDRLMIIYGDGKKIMISPENKNEFLNDIASQNPDLKFEGQTLINKSDIDSTY